MPAVDGESPSSSSRRGRSGSTQANAGHRAGGRWRGAGSRRVMRKWRRQSILLGAVRRRQRCRHRGPDMTRARSTSNFPPLRFVLSIPGEASAHYDPAICPSGAAGCRRITRGGEVVSPFRGTGIRARPVCARPAVQRRPGRGAGRCRGACVAPQSADQGYARAQYALAESTALARACPRIASKPRLWYYKSRATGLCPAQSDLGVMYETGQGVPQDHVEAVAWYRKAAEQNHARAQNNLGYHVRAWTRRCHRTMPRP